jgi:hypothetical protein
MSNHRRQQCCCNFDESWPQGSCWLFYRYKGIFFWVENSTNNKFKNSRYFVAEGSALYHEFLQLEFSNENLEFWQAVEDYKNSKPKDMAAKAQQIYKDFLTVNQSSKKQQVHVNPFLGGIPLFGLIVHLTIFVLGQSGRGDEIHHAGQHPVQQS